MKTEIVYKATRCKKCNYIIEYLQHESHFKRTCSCGMCSVITDYDGMGRKVELVKGDEFEDIFYSIHDDWSTVRQFAFREGYGKPEDPTYGKHRITRIKDMDNEYIDKSIEWVKDKIKTTEKMYYNLYDCVDILDNYTIQLRILLKEKTWRRNKIIDYIM